MATLIRGEVADYNNPKLDVYFSVGGSAIDVASLEFTIWEKVTDPNTPAQVYPVTGRQTVSLLDVPTGGRIATGHYLATYTIPSDALLGTWEIRWYFKQTAVSPEQEFREEFTVLEAAAAIGEGYVTVADLRDEGVPETGAAAVSDTRLQKLIARASRRIEMFTGRFFEPRSLVLLADGRGSRVLNLGDPIIDITEIKLVSEDSISATVEPIDLGDVEIYNRHLSGILNPDDREAPRIEFRRYDKRYENGEISSLFHPSRWPNGSQNVQITGVFGYTDPDGTAYGKTPDPIQDACMMMVVRDLKAYASIDDRADARQAWRLTELKTRDQTIKWADPRFLGSQGVGVFTGDPEIDTILAAYVRPPNFGAA